MQANEIVWRPRTELVPYKNNPRTHSKNQIRQIARSIEEFGFTNPVLIDRGGNIIAGHGRVKAAENLGLERVPTLCLEDMTEKQKRAYIIADNRLAENADWDEELLALEFEELLHLDIDLTLTGFDMGEIDLIIGNDEAPQDEEEVELPSPSDPVVTRPGDLWLCGHHRVLCGNALKRSSYKRLMDGSAADLIFTDPPYNVPIDGHVSGKGAIKHNEFAMASGEMSRDEFEAFLEKVCGNLVQASRPGSLHFQCMDWRHLQELLHAAEKHYTEFKNLCVWNKNNAGMGSLYRSRHELVLLFKNGTVPHINNVALGKYGRHRSNVWSYPGVNTFGKGRMDQLSLHPTVKPVAMIADAILDCSNPGDLVLDPFLGSGSTLLAAERTGRECRGMEIDPIYVDVVLRRFEAATGTEPVHAKTGLSVRELSLERGTASDTSNTSGDEQ
jgi:DNA modification methylase